MMGRQVVSILSDRPRPPDDYKERLSDIIGGLSHMTVEVRQCPDHGPTPQSSANRVKEVILPAPMPCANSRA